MSESAKTSVLLEGNGLAMRFGSIEVLSDVSIAFEAGKVHAIIGENGAGKSTLMKILGGYLQPTRGTLASEGKPIHFRSPVDAEKNGIVLVHQEILLAPHLTVAQNIFLGREIWRGFPGLLWATRYVGPGEFKLTASTCEVRVWVGGASVCSSANLAA